MNIFLVTKSDFHALTLIHDESDKHSSKHSMDIKKYCTDLSEMLCFTENILLT